MLMPVSSRTTSCMKPLPPNTATIFTGTPLPRTMIGPSATMPPSGALPAPTCLATSTPPRADRELDVETGVLEIALALGEPDRPERRQDRRRREQIGDLFERLRRTACGSSTPAPSSGAAASIRRRTASTRLADIARSPVRQNVTAAAAMDYRRRFCLPLYSTMRGAGPCMQASRARHDESRSIACPT